MSPGFIFSLFYDSGITLFEVEEKIDHLLVYSLDSCNSQRWTTPKPGAVFELGPGAQEFGSSSTAFPKASAGT